MQDSASGKSLHKTWGFYLACKDNNSAMSKPSEKSSCSQEGYYQKILIIWESCGKNITEISGNKFGKNHKGDCLSVDKYAVFSYYNSVWKAVILIQHCIRKVWGLHCKKPLFLNLINEYFSHFSGLQKSSLMVWSRV